MYLYLYLSRVTATVLCVCVAWVGGEGGGRWGGCFQAGPNAVDVLICLSLLLFMFRFECQCRFRIHIGIGIDRVAPALFLPAQRGAGRLWMWVRTEEGEERGDCCCRMLPGFIVRTLNSDGIKLSICVLTYERHDAIPSGQQLRPCPCPCPCQCPCS